MTHPESHERVNHKRVAKQRGSNQRTQARFSSKLEKNLWTYAVAAGAAGVGLLASPQLAGAKVVYTPTNASVKPGGLTLDLNHDGIADFYLVPGGAASIAASTQFSYLQVCHIPENGASHQCVQSSSSIQPNKDNTVRVASSGALALPAGAKIAFGGKFQIPGHAAGMVDRKFYSGSNTAQFWKGPWANGGKGSTNRYLGFKFKISGQFHYGWARLNVVTPAHGGWTATLTGYAYETVANKGIVAGQTSDTDTTSEMNKPAPARPFHPASLGLLGLGAVGLAIWRRKEDLTD
jgi:hypothetical protein